MLIFLDANKTQWLEAPAELPPDYEIAQLLTPLTMYSDRGGKYAIDNGAFAGFDAKKFRSLLIRQESAIGRCVFVAVPDVVGSARRTLEVFEHWSELLCKWPLGLVMQDGIEDLAIPWRQISAVFVGGSTEFKLSESATHVIRAARAIGKWVHVGRVNTPGRLAKFIDLGVDSIDGTGLSRYSWMRRELARDSAEPRLDFGNDAGAEGGSVRDDSAGIDASVAIKR